MADANYYSKFQSNYNPSKFFSHFLYKALAVTVFLVLLPIFPSQAPEFINQTLNTRGWEFLHLIFVGIAVSYGLFSRRNDQSEKDNNNHNSSKFDNAQSYVSRFLQVSSVFDDEGDGPTPSRSDGINTMQQTWNNQYYRNEPVVVVADHEQRRSADSTEKPLLLPVRSLKSRVLDADANGISRESFGVSANSLSRSNSGSKRFLGNLEENNLKDDVVLPSPIPWRSRSGRMEFKETKQEPNSLPLYTLPPSSMEESESSKSFRAQSSRVLRSDTPKLSSSPKKFSTETQGKSAEDFVRKKSIYRSPPPPPPPPPPTPPHLMQKSKTKKPIDNEIFTPPNRSFTSEPKSVRASRSNETYAAGGRKEKEFDQLSHKTEKKLNRDRVTFMPQPTLVEFPKEEKEETVEKLVLESEEDLETEDEEDGEIETDSFVSVPSAAPASNNCTGGSDSGPDVDKKADEFIAKFREQIRLQRIESIKRSSGQINRKITR